MKYSIVLASIVTLAVSSPIVELPPVNNTGEGGPPKFRIGTTLFNSTELEAANVNEQCGGLNGKACQAGLMCVTPMNRFGDGPIEPMIMVDRAGTCQKKDCSKTEPCPAGLYTCIGPLDSDKGICFQNWARETRGTQLQMPLLPFLQEKPSIKMAEATANANGHTTTPPADQQGVPGANGRPILPQV